MNPRTLLAALLAIGLAGAIVAVAANRRTPSVLLPAGAAGQQSARGADGGLPVTAPARDRSPVGSRVRFAIDGSAAGSAIDAAWLLASNGRSVALSPSTATGQFETVSPPTPGAGSLVARLENGAILIADPNELSERATWTLTAPARLIIAPTGGGDDACRFEATQVSLNGVAWVPVSKVRAAAAGIRGLLDAGDLRGAETALQVVKESGLYPQHINAIPATPSAAQNAGGLAPTALLSYTECDLRYGTESADWAVTYDPDPRMHGMTVTGNRVTRTGHPMSSDASAPVHMSPGETRTVVPQLARFAGLRLRLSQAGPPAPGGVSIEVKNLQYLGGDHGPTRLYLVASAVGEVGGTVQLTDLSPGPRVVSAVSRSLTPGQAELCLVTSVPVELVPGEDRELDLQLGSGAPLIIRPFLNDPEGRPVPLPNLAGLGELALHSAAPELRAHGTNLAWDLQQRPTITVYGLVPGKYRLIWDLSRFDDACAQALADLKLEIDPTTRSPSLEVLWTGDGPAELEFPVNLRNIPETRPLLIAVHAPQGAELRRVEATGVRDDGKWEYLETEPSGDPANPWGSILLHCPAQLQRVILAGRSRDSEYCGLLLPDGPEPHRVPLFEYAEVPVSELTGGAELHRQVHVIRMKPAGAPGELLTINNALVEGPTDTIKVPTGGCIVDIGYGPFRL